MRYLFMPFSSLFPFRRRLFSDPGDTLNPSSSSRLFIFSAFLDVRSWIVRVDLFMLLDVLLFFLRSL